MSLFCLVHGSTQNASGWELLVSELHKREGHRAVPSTCRPETLGPESLICRESSGERKLRRSREGRHHGCGSFQKGPLEQVFRCWAIGRDPTSVTIDNARPMGGG